MDRKCKYCNSEMDLMEDEPNRSFYVCMNEDCGATLVLSDDIYGEQWDSHGNHIEEKKEESL